MKTTDYLSPSYRVKFDVEFEGWNPKLRQSEHQHRQSEFTAYKTVEGWKIDVHYGYWFTPQVGHEDNGEEYTVYDYRLPKEGDVWTSLRNGKKFIVGKVEGFLRYEAPLYQFGTSNVIATIEFEDYYKD